MRKTVLWVGVLWVLASVPAAWAQAPPFALDELVEIVRSGVIAEPRVVTLVEQRCIAFSADDQSLARLRQAGAAEPVLNAVRRACRVLPGEPRWIRVSPASVEVVAGKTVPLKATALAPDSSAIPDALLRWISTDPAIVAVRPDGGLLAKSPGVARVRALGTNDIPSEPATVIVTPPPVPRKSQATAIVLGTLMPGGGQFYTGQTVKGFLLFGSAVASTAIGFAVTSNEVSLSDPVPPSCSGTCTYTVVFEKKRPAVVPTFIAAGGLWLYGVIDASLAARATQRFGAGPRVEIFGEARRDPDGTVQLPFLQVYF